MCVSVLLMDTLTLGEEESGTSNLLITKQLLYLLNTQSVFATKLQWTTSTLFLLCPFHSIRKYISTGVITERATNLTSPNSLTSGVHSKWQTKANVREQSEEEVPGEKT